MWDGVVVGEDGSSNRVEKEQSEKLSASLL